jgi:ABC-type molybdate transport system substrate-binding protein
VTAHGGAKAQQFVEFVRTKPAGEIFKKYGFKPLH